MSCYDHPIRFRQRCRNRKVIEMRNYIVASWNNADSYEYSGEMLGGSRHQGRSQRVHFNPDGSACVASYGDDKPASNKPSIQDRIIPQLRTLNKRTAEIIELEAEYKAGNIPIQDYTVLRSVAFQKRDRAIELYKKAINTAKSRNKLLEDSVESDSQNGDRCSRPAQQEEIVTGTFLDEISSENSLKLFAQRALQTGRVLVRCVQQAKAYIQTLKEV